MRNEYAMTKLAKEYLSKVKCCDECFCNYWCIMSGTKISALPYKGCEFNIINYLIEIFDNVNIDNQG